MAVYRGEAARRPAPIHFQPKTTSPALACDELIDDLPFEDTSTFRLQDVTCSACVDAVTTPHFAPTSHSSFAPTREH